MCLAVNGKLNSDIYKDFFTKSASRETRDLEMGIIKFCTKATEKKNV